MTAARASSPPSHWQGLRQRFDAVALRPPGLAADDTARARPGATARATSRATTRAAVLAWCAQGAGPGGTPVWRPGALPRVDQRLAVGALALCPAWIDEVACALDGSLRLDALPNRTAALTWRLGVKLRDAMWWRQRRPDDPWDAGWALTTPAALHRLQTTFQPRRATLVLADAASFEPRQRGLTGLSRRQAGFRHPVRWLWVGSGDDVRALPTLPGLPITGFAVA